MKNISRILLIVLVIILIPKTLISSDAVIDNNDSTSVFSFKLDSDTIQTCLPGVYPEYRAILRNSSSKDIYVIIKKIEEKVPYGWTTTFCAGGCYPPEIDSVRMYIPSGDKQYFGLYFNTSPNFESEGSVTFSFENSVNPDNIFIQKFYCITDSNTSFTEYKGDSPICRLYPNPVKSIAFFQLNTLSPEQVTIKIYDIYGRELKTIINNEVIFDNQIIIIDCNEFPQGNYFVSIVTAGNYRFIKFSKTY